MRYPRQEADMRVNSLILLAALAALLVGVSTSAATAAEKAGKPLDVKPGISKSAISEPAVSNNWRTRAMKSRAQSPSPAIAPPQGGNARAIDERGDRMDGEEAGSGRLREDQGNGSKLD
jgi:hypothetical protein